MPINNNISINIVKGENVSDNTQSAGPNFSAQTDSGEINQAMQIVKGDNAETMDKSQHQGQTNIAGDMTGDISNENTINNGATTVMEQLGDAFDEMTKVAESMGVETPTVPRAIPQPPAESTEAVSSFEVPEPMSFEEFVPEEVTDGSDVPAMVFSSIQQMESSPEPPTEEEQKGLFSRMYSSVKKYATSPEAVAALKLASAGIGALASTPPPFNVIGPVISTAIKLAGSND